MHTRQVALKQENQTLSSSRQSDRSSQLQDKHPESAKNSQGSILASVIGWILQAGVAISSTIIVVGLILLLVHSGNADSQQTQDLPRTLSQVWAGLLTLQPAAVIVLGLLLLIATPVLRVIVSIFAFNMEQDRRFVVITILLLAILLTSFMLGKGGA